MRRSWQARRKLRERVAKRPTEKHGAPVTAPACRVYRAAYQADPINRERIRHQQAEWYQRNRERVKARRRERYREQKQPRQTTRQRQPSTGRHINTEVT